MGTTVPKVLIYKAMVLHNKYKALRIVSAIQKLFWDNSPWVSCVSTHLTIEAMSILCSRLSFKNIYRANNLRKQCLSPDTRAGMFTVHSRRSGFPKLKVPFLQCIPLQCKYHLDFNVLWKLWQKNATIFAVTACLLMT